MDEASAPALGRFEGTRFGTTITRLSPGALVLLFTDGIIGAESATATESGLARLKQVARANLTAAGSNLLNCLLANARDFTGTREFADNGRLGRSRVTGGTAGKCLTNPWPEQFSARPRSLIGQTRRRCGATKHRNPWLPTCYYSPILPRSKVWFVAGLQRGDGRGLASQQAIEEYEI
jgi:hypothetical protein